MTEMSSIFEGSSHLETAESDDSKYYVSEFLSSPIALNPAERLRFISPASVVECERPAATAYVGGKSTTGCRCAASSPAPHSVPFNLNPSFPTRGVDDPRSRSRTTSWSKGLPHKSDVLGLAQKLSARADSGRRLGRQGKFKLFEQQLVVGLRVSVAA